MSKSNSTAFIASGKPVKPSKPYPSPKLKRVADHFFVLHDPVQIRARHGDVQIAGCSPDLADDRPPARLPGRPGLT
jgi:hypothetical protein